MKKISILLSLLVLFSGCSQKNEVTCDQESVKKMLLNFVEKDEPLRRKMTKSILKKESDQKVSYSLLVIMPSLQSPTAENLRCKAIIKGAMKDVEETENETIHYEIKKDGQITILDEH